MVGLQGVRSRGALQAKELIAQGRIGRVLSASLSVRLSGFGSATLPRKRLHTLTPESGTNLLTVGAGHAMATLTTVLGPLRSLSAATGTRTPTVAVAETGEQVAAEVPDQLTLAGELTDGAVVSAEVLGGVQPGAAHFSLHIVGSEATLDIQPVTPALPVRIAGWAIRLTDHNGSRNLSPDGAEGAVENVAAMYDALATAITTGGRVSPGFGEGLATHRLLAGIERSAQTGSRVEFTDPS
ncbi:Gfo/Idh/MocA family oxidoreductase [Streptomyces sp. NPDC002215]|uniref:Gfo/Idh/MocA family protein n=1 Tax=Streptomyces sp. NPDC002215 TaxID=3154412 RepID=UPI003327414C